jgi:agmatine deiminase
VPDHSPRAPRYSRRRVLNAFVGGVASAALAACGGSGRSADDTAGSVAGPEAAPAGGTFGVGLHAPAEWESHERTIMAWPFKEELWRSQLRAAQQNIASIAEAVAAFEPVLVVANPGTGAAARARCGPKVDVVELPIDDCWTRDSGPIFVRNGSRRVGLDFRFNGWGGKFPPWNADDALPREVCRHLGLPSRSVDLVLEGGSISYDGEGTVLTTEQCLLNPNRNPTLSKARIEERLLASLGASKVIWLPYGLWRDSITNGHVDGVAAFVAPGEVLIQRTDNGTPDDERLTRNRQVLEHSTDARGRRLRIHELLAYPTVRVAGYSTTHSYVNSYAVNGGVVVPLAGLPSDEGALRSIRAAYPTRRVVGVRTLALDYGGGGVHCVTQQVPATSA